MTQILVISQQIGGRDADRLTWIVNALSKNQGFNGDEVRIERPGGIQRIVLAHANPIHNTEGRLVGAVNVLLDITARKTSQNALTQMNAELDFLNRLAVGRENRMVEIKREVNELARDMGKPQCILSHLPFRTKLDETMARPSFDVYFGSIQHGRRGLFGPADGQAGGPHGFAGL